MAPARWAWDVKLDVSFVQKDLTIFCPPKKWSTLDPQQKLLQWEFPAMQIVKARRENYVSITQTDLLDRFNFLALSLMNYNGPSPMGSTKTRSGCL